MNGRKESKLGKVWDFIGDVLVFDMIADVIVAVVTMIFD